MGEYQVFIVKKNVKKFILSLSFVYMQYKYYEISDPFAFVFTKANGKTQSISFIISIRQSQHGNKIKNNTIIKSNKAS